MSGKAMPSAPRWSHPPHYELTEILGSGAYGTVCEALDRSTNQLVAIKRVKEMFTNLTDSKRILREIAIQTRLSHDNIVRIYDVLLPVNETVETFTELYIVMEICDRDLKNLMKMDIVLESVHILTLLYNLLVGLLYLHSAGVYHRDLKPANCMVMRDCTVKIGDFGLARAVASAEPAGDDPLDQPLPPAPGSAEASGARVVPPTLRAKRILTNHVVTRFYRAPELILLHTNYTEAIDMWSVGCIFAELLQVLDTAKIELDERGPLFPGQTAYPREPAKGREGDYQYHTKSPQDQMNVIFNIIGTPSKEAINELEREDSRRYLALFSPREGEGLAARLPHVEPVAIDLLSRMLCFSTPARITVRDALAHPLVRDIRDTTRETLAPCQVALDFDAQLDVDRELHKGTATHEQLEARLRKCFGQELDRCHSVAAGNETAVAAPLPADQVPVSTEAVDGAPATGVPGDGVPADGVPAGGLSTDGVPADGNLQPQPFGRTSTV